MPPDARPTDEEDDYESSQDSDFAPEDDTAVAPDDSGDSDADDGDKPAKRKRPDGGEEAEDAGFENSGDEAIVRKGIKKKKKKHRKDQDGAAAAAADDDEDEGGEGGLVKTRSMRAQEKEEKKTAAVTGPVTVDVDALWAQMLSGKPAAAADDAMDLDAPRPDAEAPAPAAPEAEDPPSMIRIKRTYNFAGKVHTEEKLVARDSAEAKLHLAASGDALLAAGAEDDEPARRALRRAFRSAFEPVVDVSAPARGDLQLGVAVRIRAREQEAREARKLNTVEKSRMDWAGYVDQEGLKDELELAGRSKGSYAGRQDFLARSEALREEEAYRARMAGRS